MKKDSIVMLGLACLTAGVMLGHFLTPVEVKTEVRVIPVTVTEKVPEYITEVKYVAQPYEVVKEVEVVKEIPIYPRWFNSEEELANFLERLKQNRVMTINFGEGLCVSYAKS